MRRIVGVLAAVGGACALAWWATQPPVPRHVILVSLDTTRADVLGVYGRADAHTPRIDALGAAGVVFEHHYSAAPTTLASHTALFTGNHPHTHGVPRNDYRVNDKNRMLQEVLGDRGFVSAAFLGAIPLGSHSNFTQGFGHIDERFTAHRTEDGVAQSERPGGEVVSAALNWLDEHPPGDDDRYFLFVHLFDAHAPYTSDADLTALFAGAEGAGSMAQINRTRGAVHRGEADAGQSADALVAAYRAGVATVDRHLGALVDGLEARGLLDDALLIVTADHGEAFTEHDEAFDHGETVYHETIHTPLILRFPGGWRAGSRVDDAVSNTDVFPSVLRLLGVSAGKTDGESFLGALSWPLWRRSAPVFSEATKPHVPGPGAWQNDAMHKAVVDGDTKLVVRPRQDKVELYDLASDPEEQKNLRKDQADRVAALSEALRAWRASASPLSSPKVTSARVKAELEALGYVDPPQAGDAGAQEDDAGAE